MNRMVVELTATTSTSCGGAVGTKSTDLCIIYSVICLQKRGGWCMFSALEKKKKKKNKNKTNIHIYRRNTLRTKRLRVFSVMGLIFK